MFLNINNSRENIDYKKIRIHDKLMAHQTNPFQYVFTNFEPVYNNQYINLYTDLNVTDTLISNKLNIAWLIESPEITSQSYQYILKNNKKFNIVYTFNKILLDQRQNYVFNPLGTTWLHEDYIKIWNKSRLCSIIVSPKLKTSGHLLRNNIKDLIIKNYSYIPIYGKNFIEIKQPTIDVRSLTNEKINALKDFKFHIAIENTKEDYYFSEKLIDCFLTGTVPIYYGCPSIHKFFNIKGIIEFDTTLELKEILDNLNNKLYEDMMPYIKENYEKALQYKDLKIKDSFLVRYINSYII